jgi:hypothetical protein
MEQEASSPPAGCGQDQETNKVAQLVPVLYRASDAYDLTLSSVCLETSVWEIKTLHEDLPILCRSKQLDPSTPKTGQLLSTSR